MASPGSPKPPVRVGAAKTHARTRSEEAARKLAEHEQRIYLPLVLSALLPIVVAVSRAATDSRVSVVVNVVAWLVFVYDLIVHVRLVRGYLRSGVGIFDLVVVIITAPWFLIPGLGGSQILVLARLARLVRLFFVSSGAREAARRLGSVGVFAASMLFFCSWVAYVAENPVNPDYADFGDALWWGVVTLTTVGYGDIVPITEKGRFAGVFLMFTGVATLGLISGTLASMFRRASAAAEPSPELTSVQADATVVREELGAVHERLTAIEGHLATLAGQAGGTSPPPA